MIEAMSHPEKLTEWNGKQLPYYYLELFGETQPFINTQFAEVLPAGPVDGAAQTTAPAPIYEYWWTIGHPGHKAHQNPVWRDSLSGELRNPDMWAHLNEVDGAAARVYMYFPIQAGWRIKELVATLKYLSPTQTHESLWNRIADTWKNVSPLVEDASTLAGSLPAAALPGASTAASILSAMAKLQINNVPQESISWSVEKVTYGSLPHGVMQGIMWNLPRTVFTDLGGRITGSIALSFIPSHIQVSGVTALKDALPQTGKIQAHAVVYSPEAPKDANGELWAPGPDGHGFIDLEIKPQVPPALSQVSGSTAPASTPTNNSP